MNKITRLLTVALLITALPAILAQTTENFFTLDLEYASIENGIYDPDNNGIETTTGAIDFTVAHIPLDSALNKSNLCTRWDIYSIDADATNTLCYGSESCCNFMGYVPSRSNWSEEFILTHELYGATANNLVSAQVAYIDYNLDEQNPFSEIYTSNWDSLTAIFNEEQPVSQTSVGFTSSQTFTFENQSFSLTIHQPDNTQTLETGEDILLSLETNKTLSLNYKINNGPNKNLGTNTQFQDILQGTLFYDILENQQHNITFTIDSFEFTYPIQVNDQTPPTISMNVTNNSVITSDDLNLILNISSEEHVAALSYNFNSAGPSSNQDLGESKNKLFTLTPRYGLNTLEITALDFHGNSKRNYYEFTYSQAATCSDATQNGDETGVDCGGSCTACIEFEVTLDKTTFDNDEDVFVTVIARSNATVNMTVFKDSQAAYKHLFTPVFEGAPIAETRLLSNISSSGLYVIFAELNYLTHKETKTLNFDVLPPQNNLDVTVTANATTVDVGNAVPFTASVNGAQGSVSYKWDFENDHTIDSTEQNPTKVFDTNGTYVVNLTVTDDVSQTSKLTTITVRNLYTVNVYIYMNGTSNGISGADVHYDSELQNTTGTGLVEFLKPEGTYSLRVEKRGYETYSQTHTVTQSEDLIVNLTNIDIHSPDIKIISPSSGAEVTAGANTTFRFKATDDNKMTCSIFIALNDTGFSSARDSKAELFPGHEYDFHIADLVPSSYKWKIDCVDRRGNRNTSGDIYFTAIAPEPELATVTVVDEKNEVEGVDEVGSQLKDVIEYISSLTGKEKEVANVMKLRELVERSQLEIDRVNRDKTSLKWRRLNGTDLENEEQKLVDRVEKVKQTTPNSFSVDQTIEFVKYANKEDVASLINILVNDTNLKFSKKQLRNLVETNNELQNDITVTTRAHVLSVDYISGDVGSITVIQKTIETHNNEESLEIYEIIPKTVAQTINQTTILTEHEIVKRDPIIKIDSSETSLVYYVSKSLSETDIEQTKTMLIDSDLKLSKKSAFTGFAILDSIGLTFVKTADMRLIIEILIILLLAGIYLIYSFGGIEQVKHRLHGKEVKEIFDLLDVAASHVENNEYELASGKYKEINTKFSKLDAKKKGFVKKEVVNLAHDVNMLFIDKLAKEAEITAKSSKKHALQIYKKIQSLYKIIPKKNKQTVSKKCLELHKLLVAK